MQLQPAEAVRRLLVADVARLATASAAAVPHIVAVTFAEAGGRIVSVRDSRAVNDRLALPAGAAFKGWR